jgi:general secretion pathway protein B
MTKIPAGRSRKFCDKGKHINDDPVPMKFEAPKKSMAQHRLGGMPKLAAPITAMRRRRSPLPRIAFVAALVLGVAGAWAYRQYVLLAPAPAAGDQITAGTEAAPSSASAAQQEIAPSTAATPSASPDAPLPASAAGEVTASASSVPTDDDVPTVDDMPPDVRNELPALPITMQVYSPDPKRRFVIIDGTRVAEGDSVRGVAVQEIRQTGLVLDFRGRRMLLLPRPNP